MWGLSEAPIYYDYEIKNGVIAHLDTTSGRGYAELMGVDVGSFQKINNYYGKDNYSVFYKQNKIIGADPASFKLINGSDENYLGSYSYSQDHKHVFFNGVLVKGLDPNKVSFVRDSDGENARFSERYVKSDQAIFLDGRQLRGIDFASFKIILDPYYAEDKNGVYYLGNTKTVINRNSFAWYQENYCKDDRYAYYNGEIIAKADASTFRLDPDGFARDKYRVYQDGKIIKNADPDTFAKLTPSSAFAKDKASVYLRINNFYVKQAKLDASSFEEVLERRFIKDRFRLYKLEPIADFNLKIEETNLDAKTFEIIQPAHQEFIKDKNAVYFKMNKTAADPATFRLLNGNYAKDGNHLYRFDYQGYLEVIMRSNIDLPTLEVVDHRYLKDKNRTYDTYLPDPFANEQSRQKNDVFFSAYAWDLIRNTFIVLLALSLFLWLNIRRS